MGRAVKIPYAVIGFHFLQTNIDSKEHKKTFIVLVSLVCIWFKYAAGKEDEEGSFFSTVHSSKFRRYALETNPER